MMFGGFADGWASAPMPPAASAAVPTAVLHSRSRRVSADSRRIGVSFVRRKSTYQLKSLLVAIGSWVKPARLISLNDLPRHPPASYDVRRKSLHLVVARTNSTQPLSPASALGHL